MAVKADPGLVRRWVERSCRAQGLEVAVSDGEAVGRAGTLLQEGRRPPPAPVSAARQA
ncbi:MAG: hypothetical protein ABIJ48_10480 [Actinomycetota bacterium]